MLFGVFEGAREKRAGYWLAGLERDRQELTTSSKDNKTAFT